jgi:hypothetical protein
MSDVTLRAGMDLPSLPPNHRVHALLSARLRADAITTRPYAPHAHWAAEFYGLQRVSLFKQATREQKWEILDACGRGLLEEAYFIEKSGMGFAAEMVLLAPSIEERMLYSVFAAEEARHFDAVRPFLTGDLPAAPNNPFLALLSETIECADRAALQFVIQVVLEGWGLVHYRALRDACGHPVLHERLDAILKDEAAHHGSGKVLFAEARVSEATERRIEDVLTSMLRMVQAGPAGVLGALQATFGALSRAQKITVIEELGGRAHAQERLDHLHQLVRFESVRSIIERLEARGLFQSLSPEECV